MANESRSNGIGIGMILFIVFLVLKLTGTIDWSWWWVTSPLWIPFALGGLVIGVIGIIAIIIEQLSK
jgi:hypothetical protein